METGNTVKSRDLCERCVFTHAPHCRRLTGERCAGCENEKALKCLCNAINYNTPCPYFREYTTTK